MNPELEKNITKAVVKVDRHDYATDAEYEFALEKATISAIIEFYEENGEVNVCIWQRDCDMCEGTSLVNIDATLEAYLELYDEVANNAEGPYNLQIVSKSCAESFEPTFRDRIMEAFEDGEQSPFFV